jgi:uncharacterized protein
MRLIACLLLALANVCAFASPSGVVISAFQLRGPAGGNDEFVEIRNTSAGNVEISNWKLQGCAAGSGAASARATVPAGIFLRPGQHYLFVNTGSQGYSNAAVPGDATYTVGFTDFAANNLSGIQLVDAANVKQDGVGSRGVAGTAVNACKEGTGVGATPTANSASNAYVRVADTDNNATDFVGPQASNPHNSGGITVTCLEDGVRIFQIQGRSHVSPYNGRIVCGVPGIVTQLASNGFYMQDGDGDGDVATSDGIFVFTSTAPTVVAGQQVLVKGTVSEFRSGNDSLAVTELASPTVTPAANLFANASIVPVVIGLGGRVPPNERIDHDTAGSVEIPAQTTYDPATDGIDFYESLEGMLVQVNDPRVTGAMNADGEIWIVGDRGAAATGMNARGGITIIDRGNYVDFNPERMVIDLFRMGPFPQFNVGDGMSTVVGVVGYARSNFRVYPASLPSVTSVGPARTTSTVAGGIERLRIASYNVENLDPNDNDTCDGGPDRDIADGRFTREAQQVVSALGSPDILGIEELQDNSGCVNDGTVDASLTLDTLIAAIVAAGGPAYSYVVVNPVNGADGGAPGGNIRQAILYNAAMVKHVPGTAGAGDSTTATALSRDAAGRLQLSLSPGRIEPASTAWRNSRKPLAATFDFNGRRVLVIVNHFNSKGGDEPLAGRFQPPLEDSAAQRTQQAQVEHAFIAQALALVPEARIVTLGDFNDFDFSDAMRTLTGAATGNPILTDLATALLPPEERYSYVFEGNSQELDHIYVSASLLADAQFQAVHVNAEYADQVSDHDPMIASLRILPPPPVANAGPDQSVTHMSTVALDGRASKAGDDTALTYAWTQVAGPEVTLSATNTAVVMFSAPAQQTGNNAQPGAAAPEDLVFSLTVTDRFGNVATDTVTIKVKPGRPGA